MRAALGGLAGSLVLAVGAAVAQDSNAPPPPRPDTPEQAADKAIAAVASKADAAFALGWLARANKGLFESGMSAYTPSDPHVALSTWEECLSLAERRADRAGSASVLGNIGVVHQNLGNFPSALSFQERALAIR